MMTIKKITVRVERLVVTKQYENARVALELEAELEVTDSVEGCTRSLYSEANELLFQQIAAIKGRDALTSRKRFEEEERKLREQYGFR